MAIFVGLIFSWILWVFDIHEKLLNFLYIHKTHKIVLTTQITKFKPSKITTCIVSKSCYSVGGKKYEKAQEWGLIIVNSKFIGDIIFSKLLQTTFHEDVLVNAIIS